MGGGKAIFEFNKQVNNVSKELNQVKFLIDFAENSNQVIFDLDKLYGILSKDIEKYFDLNGIKWSNMGPSEKGGGGFETFLEILKAFWKYKDFIALITSTYSLIKKLYDYYISRSIRDMRPRISIILILETNSSINYIDSDTLQYIVSYRLGSLLYIVQDLARFIKDKHGYFACDVSVEARINSINNSVRLTALDGYYTNKNFPRLLRIARSLKIKTGLHSEYFIKNALMVLREDSKFLKTGDSYQRKYFRKYFLVHSTRILGDYFK